jgi:predicted RNA-binding Zn ribbon-like protein
MGDSLAVRFANTRFAERGEPRDLLDSLSGLRRWLSENALVAEPTGRDIATFQALREATRRVLHSLVTGEQLAADDVVELNRATALAPTWRELVVSPADAAVHVTDRSAADPVRAALGLLAGSVIDLVAGGGHARVRACGGPGCVMFFEESRSHRAWCSAGCGNRARVARHYERTRREADRQDVAVEPGISVI